MIRRLRNHAVVATLSAALAASVHADVRTVTNTNDTGVGSLRQALVLAQPGDSIQFAIVDPGLQTIALVNPLPPIPENVSVNGLSQPGASCATWPPTLLIELDGGALAPGSDGITITSNGVQVNGLVIDSMPGDGVHIANASGAVLECNFIGTDATGTQDYGNGGDGVRLEGATGATIGGATAAQRNVIAANAGSGVSIDAASSGNTIAYNYIGTDVTGAAALGNFNGIVLRGATNLIGGANAGNLVSGNIEAGVIADVATATANTIAGNVVGANATDTAALPNGGAGVYLLGGAHHNTIGSPAGPNRFRQNGANGVYVFGNGTIGNSIRGNAMALNGAIGIELGEFFENPNDAGDPDEGPNRLQNTPALVDVGYTAANNRVTAIFSVPTAPANATYPLTVDFYVADADDEEGEIYLGAATYTASDFATGVVTKAFSAGGAVQVGDEVVATATDADGNTSEFNDVSITVVAPEPAGVATGLAAIAAVGVRRRIARRR